MADLIRPNVYAQIIYGSLAAKELLHLGNISKRYSKITKTRWKVL